MLRSTIGASVVLATLTTPAEACRLHRYWFYPWPQHCAAAAPRAAVRVLLAVGDPSAPSAADVAVLRAAMIEKARTGVWP